MLSRRDALTATVLSPWLAAAAARAQPAPPSLDELLRQPLVLAAALSPDGQQIALLREQRDRDRRIAFVSLIAAADPSTPPRRVIIGDFEVDGLYWANAERLLVSVLIERDEHYVPTGSIIGHKFSVSSRRMLSVGLDGAEPILLFGDQGSMLRSNYDLARIVDLLPQDPRRVLMRVYEPQTGVPLLHHVDVYSGQSTPFERGRPGTRRWFTQNGQPMLRWDLNPRGTVASLYARAPGQAEWRFVRKIPRDQFYRPDFDIVAPTEEAGVFLAVCKDESAPAATLRTFDLRTLAFGETVAERPDRDMEDAFVDGAGRYVAAVYYDDRVAYAFADPALAPHFRGMEAFLQKSSNARLIDADRDRNRFLVRASGPQLYAAWYLYDRTARRFTPLAVGKPWLTADRLAPAQALDVATRDGATIRAYLTTPRTPGPRPLVVLPHGGPEVRDTWDYDLLAQAFAAQGWLVLQPNFRGSGGYGRAFTEAGHRRWGDRMQEDVEDAVAQVVASGAADATRVAIWGASYGGYAALMGAVRRPELYRACVSIAGVSDLVEILEDERQDGEDSPYYQLWVKRIGDPKTEAARLAAASPRRRAAEIRAPVLLVHGVDDEVVRPGQSRMMASALRAARKPVEHLELQDVGHTDWEPETWKTILEASIRFIGKAFT